MSKIYINQYVFPFSKFGRMGKVHSIFRNSLNILIKNQLIHISSSYEYISSFGMAIPKLEFNKIFNYIKVGDLVRVSEDKIDFYALKGIYSLRLDEVEIITLEKPYLELSDSILECLLSLLESFKLIENVGIEQSADFCRDKNVLESGDLKQFDTVVNHLVGLGKGLTPSGDDILVAYLSIMNIKEKDIAHLLGTLIRKRLPFTTDVSAAYLNSTIDRQISLPFYNLYDSINDKKDENDIKKNLIDIQKIGHTSGNDLLFGLYLAIKLIKLRGEINGNNG